MNAPAPRVEAIERADIWAYRPFIDGLRAISIIAVVGYHLGVPGFRGGFVGVDVFFVISGYLIIGQIVAGLEAGKFSFADFWARRVLRILPPYLLVIASCFVIAPFVLLTPGEFLELGREALYSALMIVNHYFLANEGYFDSAAHLKPLLHLWTLAVEEQFYLFAPLLLFGLWRLARRLRRGPLTVYGVGLGLVFIVSLIGCALFTSKRPEDNYAFFLMPLRAWEFVAGGALGVLAVTVRKLPKPVVAALAVLGLAMVLAAIVFMREGHYPGLRALLPVGGACALIVAGVVWSENPVARALAIRPMIGIGIISYAWYLWHWPLLAFMRIHNFGERRMFEDSIAVAVSLVLAVLTHFYVERPVKAWRKKNRSLDGWGVVLAGVLGAGVIAAGGAVFISYVAPSIELAIVEIPAPCIITGRDKALPVDFPACHRMIENKHIGVVLGDSHALANFPTIRNQVVAARGELALLWGAGCLPVMDFAASDEAIDRDRKKCPRVMRSVMKRLSKRWAGKVDYAVLDARWDSFSDMRGHSKKSRLEALRSNLGKTIDLLTHSGIRRILIVGPVPTFDHDSRECIVHADYRGTDRDYCSAKREDVEKDQAEVKEILRNVAAGHPNVRFIDVIDVFCGSDLCRPYKGDTLLFKDTDHVSPMGSQRLYRAFAKDFEWVTTGKESPEMATKEPVM